MQIQRFDNAASRQLTHLDQAGLGAGQGVSESARTSSAVTGATASSSELERLTGRLGEFSDVRSDVVAAAKVRVQRGDYLTRAAAVETAAALLSKDA